MNILGTDKFKADISDSTSLCVKKYFRACVFVFFS